MLFLHTRDRFGSEVNFTTDNWNETLLKNHSFGLVRKLTYMDGVQIKLKNDYNKEIEVFPIELGIIN